MGTIVSKPSKKWAAFWAAVAAIGIGGETVAITVNGGQDSFSAQIWWILGLNRGVKYAGMAAFVAGAVWLFRHFFLQGPYNPQP
jgi:hypothetical protein